jgi:WD40 repeat protein
MNASYSQAGWYKFKLEGLPTMALSPDGTVLASGGASLRLWDVKTWQLLCTLEGGTNGLAFSPDGKLLASGSFEEKGFSAYTERALQWGIIRLWDTDNWLLDRTLQGDGFAGPVISVTFSRDGTYLAAGTYDGYLGVWQVETGRELHVSQLPTNENVIVGIQSLAFSPDGRYIAVGGRDGAARLYDTTTWQIKEVLRSESKGLAAVAFSPGGDLLALSSGTGVTIWNTTAWQKTRTLWKHQRPESIQDITFSPDGKSLAAAQYNGSIILWDTTSWEEVELPGGIYQARHLAFSPDGDMLIAGNDNGDAYVAYARLAQGASTRAEEGARRRANAEAEAVARREEERKAKAEEERRKKEATRIQLIQLQRTKQSRCIWCGGKIGFFERLSRGSQHKQCSITRVFHE